MKTARYMIEVQAGLIPEQPEQQFTKRWAVTGEQWEEAQKFASSLSSIDDDFDWSKLPVMVLTEPMAVASNYATFLATTQRVNWIRLDWIQV